jgi:hypothetical protein
MGYHARTGTFAVIAKDVAEVPRGNGPLEGIRDETQPPFITFSTLIAHIFQH